MDFAIDLETLGHDAGCVILSVGMVGFHRHSRGIDGCPEFYQELMLEPQIRNGFSVDVESLSWWMGQPDRSIFERSDVEKVEPSACVRGLIDFARENGDPGSCVWSVGTDFDVAMIKWLFRWCHADWPFHFTSARDVRTLCDHCRFDRRDFNPQPLRLHHALDDAKYAALCVQRLIT